MMANNYGVVAEHAAPHKGYSDFVQHTGPMVSGLLRVSLSDAQTLPVTFGNPQNQAANMQFAQTLCRRNSRAQIKHGGSPSLKVVTKFVGSSWDGSSLRHEKGNAANVALGGYGFFHHQENQHLAEPQGNRKPNLAYEQNQQLAVPQDSHTETIGEPIRLSLSESVNRPSLRGVVHRLQPSFGQPQNYSGISGEVQPFDSSLAFLRCSALSLRPQASSTHDEKLAPGLSFFSCSTLASILSRTSCGNRMFLSCDLLFLFPVAIGKPVVNECCVYTQYRSGEVKKRVDLSTHHELRYLHTLSTGDAQITKPGSGGTLTGPLTTNDNQRIEVAMLDHITPLAGRNSLTPNKFTWRFLAVSRSDRNAKPCRMSVEAHTEREARKVLAPHFILSLAARLPLQEVSHA